MNLFQELRNTALRCNDGLASNRELFGFDHFMWVVTAYGLTKFSLIMGSVMAAFEFGFIGWRYPRLMYAFAIFNIIVCLLVAHMVPFRVYDSSACLMVTPWYVAVRTGFYWDWLINVFVGGVAALVCIKLLPEEVATVAAHTITYIFFR